MVRGQANQSSVFGTPGDRPFSHRRSVGQENRAKLSAQPRSIPQEQPTQPSPNLSSTSSEDAAAVDDLQALPEDPAAIAPTPLDEDAAKDEDLLAFAESLVLPNWVVKPTLPKVTLPRSKSGRWAVICLAALGLFGGIGISAYFWLAGLPPLPDCTATTPLSPDAHRLYCAQEAARSGKLEDLQAGLNLVKNWSPSHPLYRDAQASLTKWSKLVMLIAHDRMNQNDFKGALDALNQIPSNSSVYPEAQETLAAWEAEWQKGETLYAKAMEAIKQQDWSSAFGYVTELGYVDHDYWRLQQADLLSSQILVQKESQEALKQAKKLAKKLTPEQLGEAIELLQTVAPNTEAWAQAQQLSTEWSQFLAQTALQYWREGNPAMAQELSQQIPITTDLPADAKDLVKFSHAQKLVEDSLIEAKLSGKQVWALLEATTAAKQIQPNSPVYSEAQAKLQNWQAQLQDLQQLQFANWMAELGQKPTLEYAIAEAQHISSDRQRYPQAQSLIQEWQGRIQQLEDLPFLQRAQQFAASQTIEDLQLAIAQAQVIPSQRSLWTQVQAQVTVWQNQIEKIEDQPMLDRAQKLAKANKLEEAIAAASEIHPDRSLYAQAQAAIEGWKEKMRAALLAEDEAVLTRARNYASQSQLTDAIAAAAQITPGRPLYLEAQAAIGDWLRERDGALKTEDSAHGSMEPAAGDLPIDPTSDPAAINSAGTDNSTPDASAEAGMSTAPGDANGDFGSEPSAATAEQQ